VCVSVIAVLMIMSADFMDMIWVVVIGQELSFLQDKIISYLYVLRCRVPEEDLRNLRIIGH
jgi:hypothetical protein